MNVTTSLRHFHRLVRALALVIAMCAGLVTPALLATPAYAQGSTGQPIAVGDIVTGTLDSENYVQVYSIAASAGDTITINLSTEAADLAPVVLITNQSGDVIAQDSDLNTPTTATLSEVELTRNGTYYIVVMRGTGAEGTASGSFTLRLSGIQQVGGQTVTLENGGITLDLQWNAAVNFDLEVRDPVGGAVYNDSPGSPSGGVLDADVNAVCDAAVATAPTETVAWPAGTAPAGSYELIIYYTDACDTVGSQVFTLQAAVDGQEAQVLTGTLNAGQEYLARLEIDSTGTWELINGGVNAGLNISLFNNQIVNATPIALGSTVSGTITNTTPAQAYMFDATAGTTVNVTMLAQSGSLDTYLALLGPGGATLADNDDFGESTNSGISVTTSVDGTYTIIATRYGLTIGGTEGDYNLSVSSSQAGETTPLAVTTPTEDENAVVTLTNGSIEVKLEWATLADLQLQVRDPLGDTVYDDIPQVTSGGTLEATGNIGCTSPTEAPVSYIYWPQNRLSPGTYEVEVWYQDNCDDSRNVTFGLSVNVNEQTIINTNQTASLSSRYMITFQIEADGTAIAGPGGFFDMTNASTLNYLSQLTSAQTIAYGETVSGSITSQQNFVIYAFEGETGDRVTIGMDASSDTLDPALYLISPENIQVEYNDDVTPGENPNSVISKYTLASTGTYYIIATHYGLNVGGTQGTYNLTLVQD